MRKNVPPPPPCVTFLYQQDLEGQGAGDGVKEGEKVSSSLPDLPEKCKVKCRDTLWKNSKLRLATQAVWGPASWAR